MKFFFIPFQLILISNALAKAGPKLNVSLPASLENRPRPKDLGGSGPHTFDYLLGADSNLNVASVHVVFVDYDVNSNIIRDLLSNNKRVICYVNVGAWEDWRSDADDFPQSVLGEDYEGWPGEQWLDIRNLNVLLPIMRARFQVAASKGCEGIDPDNMNGYLQETGFPLSDLQQLTFNRAIAEEIHKAGMLAGLKNDNEQALELEEYNDFAVVESCARYEECENFGAFIEKGKPVFGIEYTSEMSQSDFLKNVCPLGMETGISFIFKKLDLKNDFLVQCVKERKSK